MDPAPHSPLCDDTSTSREDALIVAARRQAEATTPLTLGSGSTSPKSDANGAARFLTDAMPGYDPIGEIHRGGQGVVYEAIQKSTRRRVAIKIMRDGAFASPADQARFDREILALAQLKHPNIVTIYESGASEGRRYFVMDFIHGLPLDAYVAQMRPNLAELLQLFVKIAAAVSAAHDRGIVHRDLKPSNIRISADGEPHILDFGLAKLAQNTLESLFEGDSDVRGLAHTVTGQFVGSPPWASPEQARAHHDEVDIRSDVYSLGIILYHLLVNAFPYDVSEGGMHAVLDRIIHADPVPLRRRRTDLDADLDTIVMKCLEKEPARRYATAGGLGDDLSRFLAGQPINARRDSRIYVAKKRARGFVRRRPVLCHLLAIVAACSVARWIGVPAVFKFSGLDRWFERRAMNTVQPFAPKLNHVVVVSLPSEAEIPGLAAIAGLENVQPSNKKSWRALHGKLMERLTSSRARTVAWDMKFADWQPFDTEFVRGVRALNAQNIDVVIAVDGWGSKIGAASPISPAIAPVIEFGSNTCFFKPEVSWSIPLLRQRKETAAAPSLALAAFAAYKQPRKKASFDINAEIETATISYWTAVVENERAKGYSPMTDQIRLSSVQPRLDDDQRQDLQRGDIIASFLVSMPPDVVLADSTKRYVDLFKATEQELQDWFSGRVVVLGQLDGDDRFYYTDGRRLAGVYGHAVGIEAMLSGVVIRRPVANSRIPLMLIGASLGWVLAQLTSRRKWTRVTVLISAIALFTFFAIESCGIFHYLFNPFVYIIAMIAGCELGAMVFRLHRAAAR